MLALLVVPAAAVLPDAVLRRVAHNVGFHFFSYPIRFGISFRFQVPNKVTKKKYTKIIINVVVINVPELLEFGVKIVLIDDGFQNVV